MQQPILLSNQTILRILKLYKQLLSPDAEQKIKEIARSILYVIGVQPRTVQIESDAFTCIASLYLSLKESNIGMNNYIISSKLLTISKNKEFPILFTELKEKDINFIVQKLVKSEAEIIYKLNFQLAIILPYDLVDHYLQIIMHWHFRKMIPKCQILSKKFRIL